MDWASHGAVISKLSAYIQVVLAPSALCRRASPGRPSRAKKQRRRVQGSMAMRGEWDVEHVGRGRFSLSFEQSRVVLPRGSS